MSTPDQDIEETISDLAFIAFQNNVSILQLHVDTKHYLDLKKKYKRTPLFIQTGFGSVEIKKNLPITFNGGSKKK